jgi:hypothetical protein
MDRHENCQETVKKKEDRSKKKESADVLKLIIPGYAEYGHSISRRGGVHRMQDL